MGSGRAQQGLPADSRVVSPATTLRVLIVEDHADTAESMAVLLRRDGHTVTIVREGEAVLEAVEQQDTDVVLLDIGLPGMDGYQVAKQLKKVKRAKQPLLVAITGYGGAEEEQLSAEAGIDLHVVKPADPRRLRIFLNRFRRILAEPSAVVGNWS